jgi:hypothetical protein
MPTFCLIPFVRYGTTTLLRFSHSHVLISVVASHVHLSPGRAVAGCAKIAKAMSEFRRPRFRPRQKVIMMHTRTVYVYEAWSLAPKRCDSMNLFSKPLVEVLPVHLISVRCTSLYQDIESSAI